MANQTQTQQQQVPARAEHKVEVIVTKTPQDLEKKTNTFLKTISDERLLKGIVFSVNRKTGELVHIINYTNVYPLTAEDLQKKQKRQAKFTEGFNAVNSTPNLMPNGAEISKL